MSALTVLFDVLGPVALIVSLGAFAGPRLGVDSGSLSRLAYWVLGPAFMFDIFADAEIETRIVIRLAAAGVAGMFAAATFVVVALWLAGFNYETKAASALTASYGNVGNAGLAISSFALGPELLPAAGVFMLAINGIGMMLGVGLAHGRNGSASRAVGKALIAPMTVASFFAVVANGLNWTPPLILDRSISLVAGSLIPIMLFTLGMQLRVASSLRLTRPMALSVIAKLVVAPVVAAVVAGLVGLSGDFVSVATIQSAMPPAVFCMVLALEHDLEPETVTSVVVIATLASLLTLPIVLILFG